MSRLAAPVEHGLPNAPVVDLREVVPWALLAGAIMLALLYVVGADQGIATVLPGERMHEFLHDGRHLLGFPCH